MFSFHIITVFFSFLSHYAAFECDDIDAKLGGLTPKNSSARLDRIRGIKTSRERYFRVGTRIQGIRGHSNAPLYFAEL